MRKLLLSAAVPFQRFVDKASPTHGFINRQALAILEGDGKHAVATWLRQYLEAFIEGCDWADSGWKNVGHMYDPETGSGLSGWPGAPQILREHWDLAARQFAQWDIRQAFFYLGAASHLVQDLCVPHHAAARIFAGHKQFEEYARRYRHRFAVHDGGLYNMAKTPESWVTLNARYTRQHYSHCLTSALNPLQAHEAIADLLPRAQRSTAGFVAYFLCSVGVV